MSYKFYSFLAGIACLLAACGEQPVELGGKWINTAQYNVIGQDTIWKRLPLILDFGAGGELVVSSLCDDTGPTVKEEKGSWKLVDKKLEIVYANEQKDLIDIVACADGVLTTKQAGLGEGTYRTYKRLSVAEYDAKTITQFLTNSVVDLKTSLSNLGRVEFLNGSYIELDKEKLPAIPMIWGVSTTGDGYPVLIIDGLSGGQLTWDMVELSELRKEGATGSFYVKGKEHSFEFVRLVNKLPQDSLKQIAMNFIGAWEVQVAQGVSTIDSTQKELINIKEDGTCSVFWGGLEAEGTWQLSQTGEFLYFGVGPEFNYFKIGEIKEGEITGERRCRAVPSGDVVPVRLVRQEID